jgi:hypothetical protein
MTPHVLGLNWKIKQSFDISTFPAKNYVSIEAADLKAPIRNTSMCVRTYKKFKSS